MEIHKALQSRMHDEKDKGANHILQLLDEFLFDGCHWAVLEFASFGDVFTSVVNKGSALSDETCKPLFRQLLQGIAFMHSCGVAHLDIKPENLLMTNSTQVKIADFGMAQWARKGSSLIGSYGTTMYSTPTRIGSLISYFFLLHVVRYMNPEAYNGLVYRPFLADVWSAGAVLFLLLTNSHLCETPEMTNPRFQCVWAGKHGLEHLLKALKCQLSPSAVDLLSKMLCPEATRWSATKLLEEHEWLKEST
jgi:serine/threonine-protein kinase CHEK1